MPHPKKILLSILLCSILFISSIPARPAFAFSDYLSFVILSQYDAALDIGDEINLYAITSSGKPAKWKSSNSRIASVNTYGVVAAKKAGTAVITAKITNAEASCQITVNKTKVVISKTYVKIEHGETCKLNATTSNASALTWKSSRKSIAVVDENGLVTGLKPGETIITATADQTKAMCSITVKAPAVELNKHSVILYRNQSERLIASISSHLSPTWKTNKKSVATVDANGTVTAVKNGIAVITATLDGISSSCLVTVRKPDIQLSKDEITLKEGESAKVTATVSSGISPVWTTSNPNVVTVDAFGCIKAKQKGRAYVYATEDAAKARCTVFVTE